jgi:hypothetical protein
MHRLEQMLQAHEMGQGLRLATKGRFSGDLDEGVGAEADDEAVGFELLDRLERKGKAGERLLEWHGAVVVEAHL